MTTQQFLLSAWDWNPWLIGISATALAARWLWRRGEPLRGLGWLAAGLAVLWLTLASPIDALADGYLFSAHMVQHLLLLLIVPALMLLGVPAATAPKRLQAGRGGEGNRVSLRPLFAWLCGVGGMWLWHAPVLCNAAVTHTWIHRAQYISLLLMGALFWLPIIGPWASRRFSPLPGIIYLFSACVACTILGILITFAPVEVCSVYLHPVDRFGIMPLIQGRWGLSPATDQQLGGLLMWVPACLVYSCGILGMLARWYGDAEARIPEPPATAGAGGEPARADVLMDNYHA